MVTMFVTRPVSQFDMSVLKLDAPLNMDAMFVTRPTFQVEILELKFDAPLNMFAMLVTELTFHRDMSELNVYAKGPVNKPSIFVT